MYVPDVFKETDHDRVAQFIARHPLATLIGVQEGKPVADHLPFLCLDDRTRQHVDCTHLDFQSNLEARRESAGGSARVQWRNGLCLAVALSIETADPRGGTDLQLFERAPARSSRAFA